MIYDTKIRILYEYESLAGGGRHLVRVLPNPTWPGQRLIAGAVTLTPEPEERTETADFFGNPVLHAALRAPHTRLEILMQARVQVEPAPRTEAADAPLSRLGEEIGAIRSLAPDTPHHFLAPSPRVSRDADIAAWAREALEGAETIRQAADILCRRIADEFVYDGEATEVSTGAREAFRLRRGVCQDFSHVMIAGLRALGIPAAYVSGVLRTRPPAGSPRLEGADAMHAWVRVWCGSQAGWAAFDPTNAIPAGDQHVAVAWGRDYSDVAPVVGVLRTAGGHRTAQHVDVVPAD